MYTVEQITEAGIKAGILAWQLDVMLTCLEKNKIIEPFPSASVEASQMLGEVCLCQNETDRECERCSAKLCDNCDAGDWQDQCSLCPDCKGTKTEYFNQQIMNEYEQMGKDLLFIKNNHKKVKGDLLVKKFVALAELIDWNTGNVCSEILGISNTRYRQIKKQLEENIDTVKFRVSNFALR